MNPISFVFRLPSSIFCLCLLCHLQTVSSARLGPTALALACVIAAVLSGCVPQRVTWSPDGKQALVQAADGLRLATPDGKLSDVLLKDTGWVSLWFPDSQRLLITRKDEAATWQDLTAVLTPEERAEVERNAKVVLEALEKFTGEWDQFAGTVEGKLVKEQLGDAQWPAMLVYLRETQKAKLQEKLGAKWKDVEGLKMPLFVLEVRALAGGKLGDAKTLHRGVRDIAAARISPNGRLVAFTEALGKRDNDEETMRLSVLTVQEPVRVRRLTDLASWYPDFTADSQAVAYVRADGAVGKGQKGTLRMGWVCQVEVADGPGGLVPAEEPLKEESLAQVVYGPLARVRAMPDETVVFNSPEVRLPASSKETSPTNILWTVRPVDGNDVARLTPAGEGTGAINADYFELSPDAKRLIVANTDGNVILVETASGKITPLQTEPMGGDKGLRSQPAWRSNDQACFVVPVKEPAANAHNAEVVLYTLSTKATTVLSKDWPAAAVQEFLTPKDK